jgi:dipeptidyl aminopeptidase/acylaminoacyl peptidase
MQFQDSNKKDLGGGDLQDEVYAARFLADTGYVDRKRLGITGGSYGGYMTLMAIGKTPEVWAAAVEEYGIINWMTMLQHEDPLLQQYEKSLLGDPVRTARSMSRIHRSPSSVRPALHCWCCREITISGYRKKRPNRWLRFYKKKGAPYRPTTIRTKGHGFSKRENQVDAIERTIAWFDKYLKRP